jgi:hypothetical protein
MESAKASSRHRIRRSRISRNLDYKHEISRPNIRSEDHGSSSIFIDNETCGRDNPSTLYRSSRVVLAAKGASRPMRFLKRFGFLLVFTLTLGLFCSEVPESFSLCDDTSNDFVASTPAHRLENIPAAPQEANPRRRAAQAAAFRSVVRIYSCEPPLISGFELLRLLSIQRN